jgi:hypothetical protein
MTLLSKWWIEIIHFSVDMSALYALERRDLAPERGWAGILDKCVVHWPFRGVG